MRSIFQFAFLHLQLQGFSTSACPRNRACVTRPSLLVGGVWARDYDELWGELAKYIANLQLFQLFLHFLRHSLHCLCSHRTLFCCLDPRVQGTEGKEGLLVYITCSGWLVSVVLSVLLYNCGTHLRKWCPKWCSKWDRFSANWNSSLEKQKAPSEKWKETSRQTLGLYICMYTWKKVFGVLLRTLIRSSIA